jgi:hypothetical protein
MDDRDFIGERGEAIFRFLIGKKCNGRYWFSLKFLGDKAETKDFAVYLKDPACGEATFFVQVKATTLGYTGKGAKRKLRVNVAKEDLLKLKKVNGPAFIAAIDVDGEVGFMHAITKHTMNRNLAGISCQFPINCRLIAQLWQNVEEYWTQRNMLAERSMLS